MFKLTTRIVRKTKLPSEKVLSILYSGISTSYGNHPFPDPIMTGKINSGKIKAVINPPKGWSDPFKSRINGIVNHRNERTNIDLKISLGVVIIAFYIIWFSLMLFIVFGLFYIKKEILSLSTLAILVALVLLPLGLGKLKLNWDKKRLENWISEKIETVSNNT